MQYKETCGYRVIRFEYTTNIRGRGRATQCRLEFQAELRVNIA